MDLLQNIKTRFEFRNLILLLLATTFSQCKDKKENKKDNRQEGAPNIILFFTDDQGYADVGCFDGEKVKTPNLDKMAVEGMKLTDFYVAAPTCTPSRYALMTGSYPPRVLNSLDKPKNARTSIQAIAEVDTSIYDKDQCKYIKKLQETRPGASFLDIWHGINKDEVTMAELLKKQGYATAHYGKWDMGRALQFSPVHNGFDEFLGTPNSHDFGPACSYPVILESNLVFPSLPLIENDSILEYDADYNLLTKRYTNRAIKFIQKNSNSPFFIYMAYNMPHVPLGVSPEFKGITGQGLYADVIREIDWSVGRIMEELEKQGLTENSLLIFTSDNGPWLAYGDHAGNTGPLRGGKKNYFEGGIRVPCIMKWPKVIKPGTVYSNPVMTIDLYPTFAEIAGAELTENEIDGVSILPLLLDPDVNPPREAYYFYKGGDNSPYWGDSEIVAVRSDKWKLMLPHQYSTVEGIELKKGGVPVPSIKASIDTALFNLETDISETTNVKDQHPEIVKKLSRMAYEYNLELKKNRRSVSWVTDDE